MEINKKPMVSVIIPTYNRVHYVTEAIQSVLNQTYQDFEIIVVDDGSTDNTLEAVDSFKEPRIKYIYQENRGVAAARNTGIKASSGEYIAFLDSDDIWLPQNLELKVKLLDSHPDAALVCSDFYIFDGNTGANLGRFWDNRQYPYLHRYLLIIEEGARQPIKWNLACVTLLNLLVVIIRRYVFDEVGYFDDSLRYTEDWDMWFRILKRFPLMSINLPLARYRKHIAQLTMNFREINLGEIAVLEKVLHIGSVSKEDLKFIKKKLASNYFDYGWNMILQGEMTLGRQRLVRAIRVNPWHIRPYIYLVVSILGSKGVLIARSWKKRLNGLLLPRQASSISQSNDNTRKA